jgi:hypothetical protein
MEGLGFYFIPVTENPKVSAQETRVVVRVLEGSIIVNQLTVELEKFRPDKNHKWDIRTTRTGAFIINFPSADLLDTVVQWGPMNTKTVEGNFSLKRELKMRCINMKLKKCGCSLEDYLVSSRNFPLSRQLELY